MKMTQITTVLVGAAILLLSTAAPALSNDLTIRGLKGAVKRFGAGRYYQGALFSRTISLFDRKGNITEVHTFNKKGKTGRQVHIRNNEGQLKAVRQLSTRGDLIRRIVYSYQNSAQPVASVVYNPDGSLMQTVSFSYSSSGQILQMTGYSPGKKKMFEISYQYDSNGRLSRARHLNHGRQLYYILSYEYKTFDKEGNWTRRIRKTLSLQNKELGIEIEKRVFEYH